MKTYKFFILFNPCIIYATNLKSALIQLKREVRSRYSDLRRVYVVNDKVRYLKDL